MADGTEGNGYELVVAFDRSTPDFARGAEVGILWQRLRTEQLPLDATIHASNAEMALRLAEACGCSVRAVELDDDWLAVRFGQL